MSDEPRPGLGEVVAVWALFALDAVLVAITYGRLDPSVLYHTHDRGLAGGLGRALVLTNFPIMLAAIPIVLIVLERLPGKLPAALGAVAIALCAYTGAPGVVNEDDLDAKAVNAIPAAGVALALGLTVAALRKGGLGRSPRHVPGDRLRIVLAVVLGLAALPWLFAEAGFYIGRPFLAREVRPEPGAETIRAVHLGHHHGLDGVLLALTALAFSRVLLQLRPTFRRGALTVYLALLLVYGVANALQDFWTEQLVKRGTLDARLPSVLRPGLSAAWAAMLVAAALVYLVLRYGLRRAAYRPAAPRVST